MRTPIITTLRGRAIALAGALGVLTMTLVAQPMPAAAQPAVPAAAAAAAVATENCTALLPGMTCVSHWDDGRYVDVEIDPSVSVITAIVVGGAGGVATDHRSNGGEGAMTIAVIRDIDHSQPLSISLGEKGDQDGGSGWSVGGDGGEAIGANFDGGGGGGSTALGWKHQMPAAPLVVAGGGGGGGGCTSCDGSDGGSGGDPAQRGAAGNNSESDANGSGGDPGASNFGDGRDGHDGAGYKDIIGATNAGGGGGGGKIGAWGGNPGTVGCDGAATRCTKYEPGDAGGGGGGLSYVDRSQVAEHWSMSGGDQAGSVTLVAGEPIRYGCINSHDPRIHHIPDDVDSYTMVAVGGSGDHGNNDRYSEGRGAAVTATVDVRGWDEFQYWVGCEAEEHGGAGYGVAGHGGEAAAKDAKDGGDGGGATLVGIMRQGYMQPVVAAGGGGGSGGNADCVPDCGEGGHGGNGGGDNHTAVPLDGTDGAKGAISWRHPGRGGCGACVDSFFSPDSMHGTSNSSVGGGGGGGGSGFPKVGHGGGSSFDAAGGGGGAGGSYIAEYLGAEGMIGTDDGFDTGYLLLIPLTVPKTTLTVHKVLGGDGAVYGDSRFTMQATCEHDGEQWVDLSFQIAAGTPIVLPGIPTHSTCTVTETDAGGATTPSPPQTVQVGADPAEVTMTNEFTSGGSFDVTVMSSTYDETDTDGSIASFETGNVRVAVSCELDGRHLVLPPGMGLLSFDGPTTFESAGATKTVSGVPPGALCQVEPMRIGFANMTLDVNGHVEHDLFARIRVGTEHQTVVVNESFPVAPLTIQKSVSGDGAVPDGHLYGFDATCTYRNKPVHAADGAAHLVVASGQSAKFGALFPVGGTCSVVESDRGGATSVFYPTGSIRGLTVTGSTVQVTNIFSADPLTVTATTSGFGAQWANLAFSVEVVCTLDGIPVADQLLNFEAIGGTQTLDVDEGAQCAVGEVSAAGQTSTRFATNTATDWSESPVPVTVSADGASDLAVDLTFDAVPIIVDSGNSGPGVDFANAATVVTISDCTFNGLPVLVDGGETVDFPIGVAGGGGDVPMVRGAECRVSQTTPGGASEVRYTATNSGTSDATGATIVASAPTSDNGATTVTVDNVFDVGALEVSTTVAGDAAWAANLGTRAEVTCTFNDIPLTQLAPDGELWLDFDATGAPIDSTGFEALEALPLGAECTAEQTADGGATAVTYAPSDRAVVAAGAKIGITNTFDAAEYTVHAELSGNDVADHQDDTFLFEQQCLFNGELLVSPPTDSAWTGHFPLEAGESVTFAGMPVGAQCDITMVDANHATGILPDREQSVTLPGAPATAAVTAAAAASADVVFTAVFDVTPVTVTQTIDGEGAAAYGADQTFLDQVACYYADDGTRVTLPKQGQLSLSEASGWSVQFEVPVGADCQLSQLDANMASQRELSPTTIIGFDPVTMTATNTYLLGRFTVDAEAIGPDAEMSQFGYEIECVWPEGEIPVSIPANDGAADFALKSGEEYEFDALLHSVCTVTQSDSDGAIETTVHATGTSASTAGLAATAKSYTDVPVMFEFRNYLPGSLPPTGLAIGGTVIVVILFLLAGAILLAIEAARRGRRADEA